MTAREQGRRIVKEVEDYEAKFDLGQKLEANAPAGVGIGAAAEAFPARYLYPDERDKKYAIRRRLNVDAGRPDPITDEEIDYLIDKTSGFETAEFHKWFSRLYRMDDSDPVMKKWGMELVPELWQMKEQAIDENARLQTQLAKIKLRGVRSREDLMLMWAIAKGAIKVPTGEIFNPAPDVFPLSRRGVFNPRHLAGYPGNFFEAKASRLGASHLITLPGGEGTGALHAVGAVGPNPYRGAAPPLPGGDYNAELSRILFAPGGGNNAATLF